ncbi:hypothetical protein BRC84_03355 [Halobacteriales archaeon QS_1_68_44]|nr:MAG: hypothetical protein BRC84_03355 [Halobacteriales archaeon QS_1_68_44]
MRVSKAPTRPTSAWRFAAVRLTSRMSTVDSVATDPSVVCSPFGRPEHLAAAARAVPERHPLAHRHRLALRNVRHRPYRQVGGRAEKVHGAVLEGLALWIEVRLARHDGAGRRLGPHLLVVDGFGDLLGRRVGVDQEGTPKRQGADEHEDNR